MIPPRSQAWLRFFRWVARRRIRAGLDGVYVAGLEDLKRYSASEPLIFAANHVAYWDALLLLLLDEAIGGSGFVLMDAENLKRFSFFGRIGALPIDRTSPRAALASLRTAATALEHPGDGLWFFPQGRYRLTHRPLQLQRGIEHLIAMAKVRVVPVSIAYACHEAPTPRAAVVFGEPLTFEDRGVLSPLERALADGLERTDRFFEGKEDFTPLLVPKTASVGLATRLLNWWTA